MSESGSVFEFQADVSLTKHVGSLGATEELVTLCHIDRDAYVLDVGCGVGQTPCYLAKTYGCRVVGVDILDMMIRRSKERAKREGVEDRVEFRVAEAENLPFEDETFDAVICESVTAFPKDKQRAVDEYVRVVKPGGYVGMNESTWLMEDPPPEVVAWVSQDLSSYAELLTGEGWAELLKNARLHDVVASVRPIDFGSEAKMVIQRYGMRHMFRVWGRTLSVMLRRPDYRALLKEAAGAPPGLFEYFGYGLYVGRK